VKLEKIRRDGEVVERFELGTPAYDTETLRLADVLLRDVVELRDLLELGQAIASPDGYLYCIR
jgi:hypothetical protein